MASVEISVGTAMPAAPSSTALSKLYLFFQKPVRVFDRDGAIINQDADSERHTAKSIVLMVWPGL